LYNLASSRGDHAGMPSLLVSAGSFAECRNRIIGDFARRASIHISNDSTLVDRDSRTMMASET
jgi:hypothetical protein